jgi:mRNA interferase RelE/StbE
VSEAPWSVRLATSAKRDLRRLDPPIRARVVAALEKLAADPHASQLRKLTGRTGGPESKLRVGDWRILVTLDEKTTTIHVVRVLPRGRAYKR